MVQVKEMRIVNTRYTAIILLASPFVVLGWFFASWLSQQTAKAVERPEIVVVDPPKQFDQTVARLGFLVIKKNEYTENANTFYRVRIPKGFEVETAKNFLRQQVPGLILANLRTPAPRLVE